MACVSLAGQMQIICWGLFIHEMNSDQKKIKPNWSFLPGEKNGTKHRVVEESWSKWL